MATVKGKRRRGEQLEIKGAERKRIPELEKLALQYCDARDQRMEASELEGKRAGQLLAAVKRHGLEQAGYRLDDGRLVERVMEQEKVRVRKPKSDPIVSGDRP